MPKTENLQLNTFLENEVFDVDLLNENFNIIDTIPITTTQVGTVTSTYSGGASGTATWRYKRFSDDTIELNTTFNINSVLINNNTAIPYYSALMSVSLPVTFSSVYDVHVDVAGSTDRWISIRATSAITSGIDFYILSRIKTTSPGGNYNQIFIQVKGVEVR